MGVELVGGFVMKALDGRLLDRAVHSFDLVVGLGVGRFSKALRDAQVLFVFFRLYFGKIDAEVADGIVFKLLFLGFVQLLAEGPAADAMALKTTVQG